MSLASVFLGGFSSFVDCKKVFWILNSPTIRHNVTKTKQTKNTTLDRLRRDEMRYCDQF